MAFAAINRQFTRATFAAYLATMPRPGWAHGSTYHNTYKPTEAQWRGLASMQNMQATYQAKGWTSGPHCYLALGAPDPAHDGIWVMTPPSRPGTHAGACNASRFGLEVVGDFEAHAPSATQQQLLVDTVAMLHRWAGLGADLVAHRDCMADRTCPGSAFYAIKPQLIAALERTLAVDPLRARSLPGPQGPIFCSAASADFYTLRGGLKYCGYPLADEYRAIDPLGVQCSILKCERVIIKQSAAYGVEQALLVEALDRGWIV